MTSGTLLQIWGNTNPNQQFIKLLLFLHNFCGFLSHKKHDLREPAFQN